MREQTLTGKNILALKSGMIVLIYCMLKPLYLSASGGMQICDYFFIISFLYIFITRHLKFRLEYREAYMARSLMRITIYIICINSIWFLFLKNSGMIRFSLYYVFNLLVFVLCIIIKHEIGTDKLTFALCKGCFISALITAIGLILFTGSRVRSTGFFNNPNQLGYYALIVFTVVTLFPSYFTRIERIIVYSITLWAVIVSASKAAIASAFVMMLFMALFSQGDDSNRKTRKVVIIIGSFLLLYGLLFANIPSIVNNPTIMFVRRRMLRMFNENDSSLATGRGYARVLEMGIHFLWGVGEGAFYRFKTMPGYEVHSMYISLLVSYGVIGLCSFIIFFYNCVSGTNIKHNLCCFSGIILYSVTHNGIRNTLLWILLATIFLNKKNDHNSPGIPSVTV